MEPLTAADPLAVREFRVLARLGAGGMGRVYLASSPAGRLIAVKVIQPQFATDGEFIRRFRGEVDAARRVSGLYTAPVVAAGLDDSPPWLATAFVPGPSLQEVVAGCGPLPLAALWRLAAGLAEALRAIHSAGLVHRDLKPANVLLASDGPRVIDFGISRAAAAGTRMTAVGAAIGTPSYMSPEQVEGTEAGPPSDVFSFGSVLAFAATGASPFAGGPGASAPSVMFRVAHGEPALDGVPGDVLEVVAACLAKDPARRPDLGQVAARSTAAAGYLELSPAAFWPGDVANAIDSHVAALSARLQALQVPAGQLRSPAMNQPGAPGTGGYPGGPGGVSMPPACGGQPGYPGGQFPGTPPAAPRPVTSAPAHQAMPAQPAARGTSSRRAVLLAVGGGVAGAAVLAGAGAWALSALSSGGRKSSGNASSGPGSLAWRYPTSHQPGPPTASGGLVYFGSGDLSDRTAFYAVSAASGRRAWIQNTNRVSVAPTVAGGVVCMVDTFGNLYGVNAAKGTRIWEKETNRRVDSGMQTWDANSTHVAFAPGDGSVRLFHAATGKEIWKAASSSAAWIYVALAGPDIYAFDPSYGILSALSVSSGQQLWHLQVFVNDSGSDTGLAAGGGSVYIGGQGGWLYCVDVASRQLRWRYSVPGPSFPASRLVIGGGLVYFTDDNSVLRAVTTAHGEQAWSYQLGGPGSAGAYANGYLYVPDVSALQQLHAASGTPGWSFTPDSGDGFGTAGAGGGLVFATGYDMMYAIRA